MTDILDHSLNQNQNQNQNEAEESELNDRATAAAVNLPPELMYDILCRLPAKSVGRYRCVSNDWNILLSDPKFLKDQFLFNNHQTKIIVLQDYNLYSIDFRNDCNNEGNPVTVYEALKFLPTKLRYDIRGSCRGLILLVEFGSLELSIVNPISHKVHQLPSVPQSIDGRLCLFEFGYCLKDDEYTVIIVSNFTPSSPVYMLKRNLWKRVEDSPLALQGCGGAFVNDCIHWLGYRALDKSIVVCAFDLASERFREVEIPEGLNAHGFQVNVLGGCICLVRHRKLTIDIWVMKEYGLRDSWTKYVVYTSQRYLLFHPLFFWKCDESIVAETEGGLIFCCLKQKTSANLPLIGAQPCRFHNGGRWIFVESLFSPKSSNALDGPNQVQV